MTTLTSPNTVIIMKQHRNMESGNRHIDSILTELMGGNVQVDQNGNALHFDSEKAYERFEAHKSQKSVARQRWYYYLVKYVAVVLLLVTVAYSARIVGIDSVRDRFADITIEAPYGSSTRMMLPDNSVVWLNAGSRLTYSQGFGVEDRNLKLEGEGYFEIAHNESLPLSVSGNAIRVQVLGTKFNFRDYADEECAEVTLAEGCVALYAPDQDKESLRMKPNQQCVINKLNGKMTLTDAEAANSMLWISGQLFFDDEPLERIASVLNHSYNVCISIEGDSLRKIRFYGDFARRDQNIDEVLDVLAATGKIKYRKQDNNIIFY